MTDEEYVRSVWTKAEPFDGRSYGLHIFRDGTCIHHFNAATTEQAWSAAAAFTRERKDEIARLDEEIALTEGVEQVTAAFVASIYVAKHIKQDAAKELPIWRRTRDRLQLIRAELTRGMKEGK